MHNAWHMHPRRDQSFLQSVRVILTMALKAKISIPGNLSTIWRKERTAQHWAGHTHPSLLQQQHRKASSTKWTVPTWPEQQAQKKEQGKYTLSPAPFSWGGGQLQLLPLGSLQPLTGADFLLGATSSTRPSQLLGTTVMIKLLMSDKFQPLQASVLLLLIDANSLNWWG